MKHLTLFAVVVLLTVGIINIGFAGNAPTNLNTTTPVPTVTKAAKLVPQHHDRMTDSDISGVKTAGKISSGRFGMSINQMSPSIVRPVPEVKAISSAPLAGTYTIPSATYPYLGAAIADLNANGLSADVTFQLSAAAYYEYPITIGGTYPGAGTYNVTIKPAAGVAAVINFTSLNVNGKGFSFVGAMNVTIDGVNAGGSSLTLQYGGPLSVFPNGDPMAATVYITGISDGVTLKNTVIKGQVNNAIWANQTQGRPAVFAFTNDADGDFNYNITIDGCQLTEATYGMKALDADGSVGSIVGLTIQNTRFGPNLVVGGLYEILANVLFQNNVLDGITYLDWYWNNAYTEFDKDEVFAGFNPFMYGFGQSTGGHFLLADNAIFRNNIYRNIGTDAPAGDGILTYGTRVYGYNLGLGGATYFYNNVMYDLTNPGGAASQINGVRGPLGQVWHNSIRLTGALAAGATTNCVNGVTAAYNNAFSNEITGIAASGVRGVAVGGTFDYNAVYSSTGYFFSGYNGMNAALAAAQNSHGVFAPISFNSDLTITTGPSAAENAGTYHLPVLTDFTGAPVDTTIAGSRDAGAYQFSTGVPYGPDVAAVAITSPLASVPIGLAQIPKVLIKNNTPVAISSSFNVSLTTTDGYSQVVPVASLGAGATATLSFPAWTATSITPATFTATIAVSGDVNAGNDVATIAVTGQPPLIVGASQAFDFNTTAQGWTGTNDWVLSSTFTKLGGVYSGSGSSWVTNCPKAGWDATYTDGAYANSKGYASTYPGPNFLTSPWLDLSAMPDTNLYISFVHSIQVEPGWDGSYVEYTTDGVNWKKLGKVSDADGINWYDTLVYANAKSYTGDPPDTATMKLANYGLYGPGTDIPSLPTAWWTSNGLQGPPVTTEAEGNPTGPTGWIYSQLHITPAKYPGLVHAPVVKFRYTAFSDAVNPPNSATAFDATFAGWALDNFTVGTSGGVFLGGHIAGTVFTDDNGDGLLNGAEAGIASAKIYVSYFGVLKDSVVTDGTGHYDYNLAGNGTLPGTYNLYCVRPGFGFTVPYGATGKVDVNHPSNGSSIAQDFGVYQGAISGNVIEDLNNNAVRDGGEPGIVNYTVEVHKDSLKGALVGTAKTPASGAYTIPVPPGTFVVTVLNDTTISRRTLAASNITLTISGNSGSGTALATGQDFGLFLFGTIISGAYIDQNGNGVKELVDVSKLPGGIKEVWRFTKVGGSTVYDTLGNGDLASKAHPKLDAGTYILKIIGAPPTGWVRTFNPDSVVVTIGASSFAQSVYVLDFMLNTVSGNIYEDVNGNGTKDGGEGNLVGIAVTMTGAGGGATVTDASGNYVFTGVGGGAHVVSETLPTGWIATQGVPPLNIISANYGLFTDENFGNFKKVVVTGNVFRDRANNGVKDLPQDNGVAGVTVYTTQSDTAISDANGDYSLSLAPQTSALDTIHVVVPAGFVTTLPTPVAQYTLTLVSGGTLTARDFGLFQTTDTKLYRTLAASELETAACGKVKVGVQVKAGKTPVAGKNFVTMANVLGKAGIVTIGYGVDKGGTGWLQIAKLGDLYKTLCDKSVKHTGPARGFDVTAKSKVISGKQKSLSAGTKNDVLISDLVTLQVNLALSVAGTTPSGLGSLKYFNPGNPFDGMTIDQIADKADTLMSDWGGVTYATYTALAGVVEQINGAFTCPTINNDSTAFNTAGTVTLRGCKAVTDVAFLKANPGVAPQSRHITDYVTPVTYTLNQNYPNPFNPTTAIGFDLPQASIVTIKVYNILGQEIATLLNHERFDAAGSQEVSFDATGLASGVYLYRIQAETITDDGNTTGNMFSQVKKMVLVK